VYVAPRVAICESNEIARIGIERLLTNDGIEVVAVAATSKEALRLPERNAADVYLVDVALEGAAEVIAAYVAAGATVIATGAAVEPEQAFAALKAGAVGFLTRDQPSRAWVEGIRAALRGEAPLSRRMTTMLVGAYRDQAAAAATVRLVPDENRLTRREWQVLSLIAGGRTNRDVSAELCISVETVRTHVSSILAKLDTPNRSAAAVKYHQLRSAS
jgi:DNA-binding NarL/FixJ family response regulator